jgi:hypothetical protein
MSSRAVVALAIVVCVGLCLTGLSLAAKIGAPTARVGTVPPRTDVAGLSPQPEPPDFPVMSVQQLRGEQAGLARIQVRSPGRLVLPPIAAAPLQQVKPGARRPAYAEGSGVVLDVTHPFHEATESRLVVRGVVWDERVRREVLAADPDTSFVIGMHEPNQLVAGAYFSYLPSAAHTYMVTVGTSAAASQICLRIGGNDLSSGDLFPSPATCEVRALFTYEAGSCGNHLTVLVQISPSTSSTSEQVRFHHVQLAQLD